MLENIIYHTVILVFIVLLIIYTLRLQKKCHDFKESLIPFLLAKELLWPRHRSLFLRGIAALEEALSEKFGTKVTLEYDKTRSLMRGDDFRIFIDFLFYDKKHPAFEQLFLSKKMKRILFKQMPQNSVDSQNLNWNIHIL